MQAFPLTAPFSKRELFEISDTIGDILITSVLHFKVVKDSTLNASDAPRWMIQSNFWVVIRKMNAFVASKFIS